MIYLNTAKTKTTINDSEVNLIWIITEETISDLAYHSETFPSTVTDAELLAYEKAVAIPNLVNAVNTYLGLEIYTSIAPIENTIDNALTAATNFGLKIVFQFKRENVLLGISYTDKIPYIQTFLHDLLHYLESGSAKEAINELDRLISHADTTPISRSKLQLDGSLLDVVYTKLELAPFITNQRLTSVKHQLQDFYGMIRT